MFINFHVHGDVCLGETLVFATCLYHGDAFWHLISIGEIIVLLQWELKNAR